MWIGKTTQRDEPSGHSRRHLLRVGALLALAGTVASSAGCDLLDRNPEPDRRPDPLAPLIAEALDLAARYESVIAASPDLDGRLTPIVEAHRAHARELARVTGTALPSGTPGPATGSPAGDSQPTVAALRAAEQQARETAVRTCAEAPAERAALVGSIAAARATHVEALK